MCWGFQGPVAVYVQKSFQVRDLLFDVKPGQCWYAKPWLEEVVVVDGREVKTNGTFMHRSCLRVSTSNAPWAGLTCNMCATIPCQIDFRLRLMREDKSVEKQGTRTTKGS